MELQEHITKANNKILETIYLERHNDILVVFLNRPEVLNAVTSAMRVELCKVLASVNDDPSMRAVVITGAGGKAFCAGQDLKEASTFTSNDAGEWMEQTRRMFSAIRDLDKPCVAAVNGVAAGAGLQIALLCDLRVGCNLTRMSQPEIKAGLGSVLGSHLLSLYFGHARSAELSLTARFVAAQECLEIGLLNKLVENGSVLSAALEVAEDLTLQPIGAFQLTKKRYRQTTQTGFDDAFSAAHQYIYEAYETGEPQAIMSEFKKGRRGA